MTYPFGRTVTLVARVKSGTNGDGNDVLTAAQTVIPGCAFWWGVSAEQTQERDSVTTDATVILPPGTNVAAIDAVIVGGSTFEVTGDPADWSSPFSGWAPGVEVRLQRKAG